MEQKIRGFIPYLPFFIPEAKNSAELAGEILDRAEMALPEVKVLAGGAGEGYSIRSTAGGYTVSGGDTGVLYGVHALLRSLYVKEPVREGEAVPYYPLRMLNHWDNMDGSVERGYAGLSLFFRNDRITWNETDMHRYGMMLSSTGINAVCLNNVNVHFPR
jgi:Alpha-glucuronidase